MTMDEIPPAEAFEPRPDDPIGPSRLRRRLQVAVTLLLVAALVILAAVEGGGFIIRNEAPAPTPAPADATRLAFVDAAGALTTMDGAGGSSVGYSVPGVAFRFPAWSPDGSRIATVGETSEGSGVYVFAVRTPADPPLEPALIYHSLDGPPFYLYWTPDSRQVTFLTTDRLDSLSLRIAPADASSAGFIVREGAPMYWDFVDPGRLLVHAGPDGFLGEMGLDGISFGAVPSPLVSFRAPAVSSDGRYRAYVVTGGGTGEVVLESRDGSGSRRVPVFGPAAVSFRPAGHELAFLAPDQPNAGVPLPVGPLRLLDPASADTRTLIGGSVVAFFWSASGSEIAALLIGNPDDNVTEANAGGATLAAAHAPAREAAAGLPLRLAFVDVASGAIRSERVVQLSDVFVNQVLPFFDQYALSHRFWSPDGRGIVLPIVGEGDITQLVAIPPDGSEARVVATAEMGSWSP
jgi:TolB protein